MIHQLKQPLTLYLLAVLSLSVVMGIQIVLIPWLVIDYLQLGPSAVGLVQAAVFIPNLLLLVFGGISADRGAVFTRMIYLLLCYTLVHVYLLVLLSQHGLSLVGLLVYSLLLGSIGAFVQPCKDYLAGLLAQKQLQKTVAKTNLCQYLGQALGIGLASLLYDLQLISLPPIQILLIAAAVFYLYLLKNKLVITTDSHSGPKESTSASLLVSGFLACWQSPTLRTLIAIVAFNGFFHIGVFIVALPVLAKTIYLGDIGLFSLLQCLFIAGTVISNLRVIIRGDMDGPGRRVIFCLLYGGLILLGLSMGPTPTGMMILVFLWGAVVGVSATLGRTILHSQATANYRGRVISIYQFALFGCAPLGSLLAGIAIEYWGVLYVLKVSAIASFIAFTATFLTRSLWALEADETRELQ